MRPCHALIEKPDARSSDATRSREFTVPRWAGCSSLGVGSSLIDTAAVGVSSWSLEKSFAICERHDAVQTHRPAKKLLAIKDIYHAPARFEHCKVGRVHGLDPRGVDVRQTTSATFIGITIRQVFKSPGRSSEPHSFRAAWAKRRPWRVFTRVFVTHDRSGP
jgi:hypothetical protein